MALPSDDQKIPFPLTGSIAAGSIVKERDIGPINLAPTEKSPDKAVMVEPGKVHETKAEKDGLLERVKKELELEKPVTNRGQVLVTSPTAENLRIVLPVSQGSFLNKDNWHLPVTIALRWRLEWTKRIVKANPDKTVFRES